MSDWKPPNMKPTLLDLLNEHNRDRSQCRISMAHLAHDAGVPRQVVYDLAQRRPVPRLVAVKIVEAFNARTRCNYTVDQIDATIYE